MTDAIERWHKIYGLNWLCQRFNISKSTYYSRLRSRQAKKQKQEIIDFYVYEAYHRREQNKISGTDGYRLIHSYLLDERLFTRENLNAYHVLESMRRLNIQAIVQRRKRFVKPGEYCQAFDDLVQRKFVPEAPNKIWYTDFTYVRVGETFCYVCIIIDGFSGEVIASKVSSHIDTQLACETLEIAINRMKPKERVILRSDQGG